jgi:hypothetical protein
VVKGIRKKKQVPLSTTLLRCMGPTLFLPTLFLPLSFLPGVQTAFKKSLLGQVHHLNADIRKEVQLCAGTEARSREEIQLNFDTGDIIRSTAAREGMEHNR